MIGRGPETPRQFYGGDLDGIAEHLDHIADLGANTVYLTPIFPARSNHRYDAASFDEVDPLLGGDAALDRLAGAVHERGMRLLGDITTNHTGDAHPWFTGMDRKDLYYVGSGRLLRVLARRVHPAQARLDLAGAARSVLRRAGLGHRALVARTSTAGGSTWPT